MHWQVYVTQDMIDAPLQEEYSEKEDAVDVLQQVEVTEDVVDTSQQKEVTEDTEGAASEEKSNDNAMDAQCGTCGN